ncbi:helix-turn-helix domain-containing protein [Alicyclobacillus ferrooxydans]|uniref:helix-turn-helix domain-containing protein n=1 Tax=Alicyclobacillus ferrooxydans TaxID=471514 RepID=UPI0006D5A99F|nr:helix-turn-helix domain-containing protein [Alicyclobacillus ferrooxydans]
MDNKQELTLREAAEAFGVSTQTLRRWIKDGKLQAELKDSAYGSQYYIKASELPSAEVREVIQVDRTVDMKALGQLIDQLLHTQRNEILVSVESLQTEFRESMQQRNERENQLLKELSEMKEQYQVLQNHVDEYIERRAQEIPEQIRTLLESREPQKHRWWPFGQKNGRDKEK